MTLPDRQSTNDVLNQERVDALNALQAMRDERLDLEGGYPAVVDGTTIRGYVLIADSDDNDGPSLTIYRWKDVLRWYRAALQFLKENPIDSEDDVSESHWEKENNALPGIVQVLYETEPDNIAL